MSAAWTVNGWILPDNTSFVMIVGKQVTLTVHFLQKLVGYPQAWKITGHFYIYRVKW